MLLSKSLVHGLLQTMVKCRLTAQKMKQTNSMVNIQFTPKVHLKSPHFLSE